MEALGKIVDRKLFLTTCEGGKHWPFEERCTACKYCREIRVSSNDKIAINRQNLYLEGGKRRLIFDSLERFSEGFPELGREILQNQRAVSELVCIAGRVPDILETYVDAFRIPVETGSCWQQSRDKGINKLCNHCAADLSREGALSIPPTHSFSFKGRLVTDEISPFKFEAIGKRGSRFHKTAAKVHVVNCAKCNTTIFTQNYLNMEGGEEEREHELSSEFLTGRH